jgi:hypothetical protein
MTHRRGRGEAGHAPEHRCDGGGGACGGGDGDGSRVCGGGDDKSAGRPAEIRAGRAGRIGRQASGSNWDREVGAGEGRRDPLTSNDHQAFIFRWTIRFDARGTGEQ